VGCGDGSLKFKGTDLKSVPLNFKERPGTDLKSVPLRKNWLCCLSAYLYSQMGGVWGVFSVRKNMSERSELFFPEEKTPHILDPPPKNQTTK
jgi:hypothetical protein